MSFADTRATGCRTLELRFFKKVYSTEEEKIWNILNSRKSSLFPSVCIDGIHFAILVCDCVMNVEMRPVLSA
jgi:hypothetical protein